MRAQSEAPIELLIGVTVLTFVLIIASYVFNSSCATQQENKLQVSFSQFSRDLNSIYFGSVGSSLTSHVDFGVSPGCMTYTISSIRIAQGPVETCMAQLGRPGCYILIALTSENGVNGSRFKQVLDISTNTKIINNLDPTGAGACNQNLGEINWNDNTGAYDKCWFDSRAYSIRIKKTASDEITLSMG